ncbi:MAG: alkaline phosphatase family protein [Candidatus Nanopelagicales bacterium]
MNIWEVMPAALSSLTGQGEYVGRFPSAKNVVVLLVDGMGVQNLEKFIERYPLIERLIHNPGRTTLPSTTPVALASLGTTKSPSGHGFLGATFMFDGEVLQPLKWSTDPHPMSLWPDATVFEEAAKIGVDVRRVGPGAYRNSGLTNAVLRGGQHINADSLDELVEVLPNVQGQSLTYGYYPTLDRVGHVYGCNSDEYQSELRDVLDAISKIETQIPNDTLLVITADHGMVDMSRRIWLEDEDHVLSHIDIVTGEPRFRHIFTKNPESVVRHFGKYEEDFLTLTREEFIESLAEVTIFEDRIGDVVVIAKGEDVGLCSRTIDYRVSNLIGQHGGASDTERDIPIALMAG